MTDIELLREAARLMRERAEAATPSPWGVGNDTNIVRGLEVTGRGSYTCIQSVVEVDDDRCDWDRDEAIEVSPEYDAEHIASWHPAVALAIADWLDAAAQREEEHRQRSAHYAYAEPTEGDEVYGALIVTRAYLGVEA